jgi:hypothetical protein
MGPFALLLKLPLLPVDAVIKLGEIIRDEAESEYSGGAAVRAQLEALEDQLSASELSPEEAAEAAEDVVRRMIAR